ncbi:hypothetical protein BDZ89DRAFT_1043216 [Hymenopellis radicata]|nr:hypothetical protein BDZ89DRAFT_1043216 [Hymenopellis radicata]
MLGFVLMLVLGVLIVFLIVLCVIVAWGRHRALPSRRLRQAGFSVVVNVGWSRARGLEGMMYACGSGRRRTRWKDKKEMVAGERVQSRTHDRKYTNRHVMLTWLRRRRPTANGLDRK